jgi:phosphoribosyl-ATP pyrophosphohydrolase/phosphoribosyl-AMP cyclohydrolase
MTLETIRFDDRGLVPAIVQDLQSGAVLMLAYMNRESLQKTLDTGETHFWSRSRKELWHKGETSGHTQKVVSVMQDCDGDALLVKVEQSGVACHTGAFSCFHNTVDVRAGYPTDVPLGEVLGAVARVIHQRNSERPEGSYTVKLLSAGLDKVLKKVGEESGEVIIAAKNHAPAEITWEVADLLYHTLVMMELEGIGLEDIAAVLDRRRGGEQGVTARDASPA